MLITGESGTGKEVLARYVHQRSTRKDRPFVSVNCAAIPDNLLESELFGHEKGAFTGAVARRIGKFEEANGGTLLLDEISEMDVRLQAKLLRAIQERVIDRVGGAQPVRVDIRILATSNRNLADEVRKGTLPRGPALPAQRRPPAHSALARAAGGRAGAGCVLRAEIRRSERCSAAPADGRGEAAHDPQLMARQRARARERDASRGAARDRARDRRRCHPHAGRRGARARRLRSRDPCGADRGGRHPRARRTHRRARSSRTSSSIRSTIASATARMPRRSSASRSARCATSSANTPRPEPPCRSLARPG